MAQGHLGRVIDRVRRLIGADALAQTTDAQLLERFQTRRDGDAFAALVERHGPMVLGVCRRVLAGRDDAEDAFQATFLLFARKADTIHDGTSVAGWLYRVAYRTALRARATVGRRRDLEKRAAAMSEAHEPQRLWDDLQPVLDEEIQRLPAKYRDSIVVRYLQGKSNEEAARQLGVPPGSLSWRLSKALEMLRHRLARRGITSATAVLTALLIENGTDAAVPVPLAAATAKAGVLFACGSAVEGASVSVRVFLLVEGGLRAMFLQQLTKIVTGLALVLLLGGLGVLGYPLLAETPPKPVVAAAEVPLAPDKPAEKKRDAGLAVDRSLHWLARHQAADGHWSLDGSVQEDVAGTALGLLPFLLIGENHKAVGFDRAYTGTVAKGLRALIEKQKADGSFTGMYPQGLAAWALCEAYRQTGDAALQPAAQRALDYIIQAQHEGGGWRYAPKQAGDTSVTAWQILALSCGKQAALKVPDDVLKRAGQYLDGARSRDGKGYLYTPGGMTPTPGMTAAALSCRLLLGWKSNHPDLAAGTDLLEKILLPDAGRNVYAQHWATRALKGIGGDGWKRWEPRMRQRLLDAQEDNGPDAGSWPADGDAFGQHGGRLMVTSLSLITLELCAEEELRSPGVTPRALGDKELVELWKELAGPNPFQVRRTMAQLIGDPRQTVAYLKEQLKPAPPADAKQIERLIADLDSDSFTARQKAEQSLEELRELAEPALRNLLEGKPSLEVSQRVRRLLQRLDEKPAEVLRSLRAVTVLERLATAEAREVLKHLATGTPEAWQTREAKAALERLEKQAK